MRTIAGVAAALLISAGPLAGQARELTLDMRPWSADVAMAWRVAAGGHLAGFSIGAGADDFSRTFRPATTSGLPQGEEYVTLEQIVRMGPFYRYEHGGRLNVDVGLRLALGGVRGISGSPGVVTGVQAGVYYGGRHVRVGPRLFVGNAREGNSNEQVVHVDWLTARLRLPF